MAIQTGDAGQMTPGPGAQIRETTCQMKYWLSLPDAKIELYILQLTSRPQRSQHIACILRQGTGRQRQTADILQVEVSAGCSDHRKGPRRGYRKLQTAAVPLSATAFQAEISDPQPPAASLPFPGEITGQLLNLLPPDTQRTDRIGLSVIRSNE